MWTLNHAIQNIHSATQDFEAGQREEKQKFIQVSVLCWNIFYFPAKTKQSKKEAMIKKQHEDVVQLLETQASLKICLVL